MKSEVIEIDDIEDVKDVKDEGSPSTEPASQAEDKSPNASQEKGTLKVSCEVYFIDVKSQRRRHLGALHADSEGTSTVLIIACKLTCEH